MNNESNRPQVPCMPNACPNMVLAMAYILDQMWADIYEPELGLARGTIYPGLDKPFIGEGSSCK